MSEWFANGQSIDTVDIRDRAVQYGDGLFETIANRDSLRDFGRCTLHACNSAVIDWGLPQQTMQSLPQILIKRCTSAQSILRTAPQKSL